ncbi:energy transducer TonB [Dyella soli]|nr:energy transducer TonB [Dyella soli]
MKTGTGKTCLQMVGALCMASGIMAMWAPNAYGQDQASPSEPATAGSTQPAARHFYSLGGSSRTRPSSMNLTTATRLRPKYPPEAIRDHHEGTVMVMAQIGVNGQVTETRIEQSSGYRELDDSAATAVGSWTFRPAIRDGVPVVSWARVPVNFALPKPDVLPSD